MKKILFSVALFVLGAAAARADVYGEFGIGISHPARAVESGAKNVELGYTNGIHWGRFQAGLGGWVDKSGHPGARNSAYTQFSMGLEPDLGKWFVNYFFGPSYVLRTDALLGSHWQFFQEVGIGVKDYRGIRLGIVAKHLSNAGIIRPNKGRNFINLRVQF